MLPYHSSASVFAKSNNLRGLQPRRKRRYTIGLRSISEVQGILSLIKRMYIGQLDCLRKSVVSLYPASKHVNVENILELIQAHHTTPEVPEDDGNAEIEMSSDMDNLFQADDPF